MERRELPTVWKRSAERNGLMWLDGVCTWLEVCKRVRVVRRGRYVLCESFCWGRCRRQSATSRGPW